jgi:hypothetical protein
VAPNLLLLQNALDQTQGSGGGKAECWQTLVRDRLMALDMAAIRNDVGPFLEPPQDAALLTHDGLLGLLQDQALR